MYICGIDEAGRGPLAGPLVVSAVIFEDGSFIDGVRDSKKLSPRRRQELYKRIISECTEYSIEIISHDTVDDYNVLKACMKGMKACLERFKTNCFKLFVDGNYFRFEDESHKDYDFETVIHGDDTIFEISCASILAKVTRDDIMEKMHEKYPVYNFIRNKGYGTKEHISRIREYGICEIHRKTFTKKYTAHTE